MLVMSHQHQLGRQEGLQKQYQRRYHRRMTVACDQVAGPVHRRKDIFVGLVFFTFIKGQLLGFPSAVHLFNASLKSCHC